MRQSRQNILEKNTEDMHSELNRLREIINSKDSEVNILSTIDQVAIFFVMFWSVALIESNIDSHYCCADQFRGTVLQRA